MAKIIPVGQRPLYTLKDLSVVVPQASQYVRRIKWFIPQYIKGTPPEVVKNTIVTYDPEDLETKAVLEQYGVTGLTVKPPHSTYKQESGFNQVKTRLCARIHNDTFIERTDWAQSLVDQFNKESTAQLIGAFNISGGIFKETLDKLLEWYPSFRETFDSLEFSEGVSASVGTPYLSAFAMAAQTYVFRGLYPLVVEFNDGSMNKEDVITTLLFSLHGVRITQWNNMYSFLNNVGSGYGDFDEGITVPTEPTMINELNRDNYDKPVFTEVNYKP